MDKSEDRPQSKGARFSEISDPGSTKSEHRQLKTRFSVLNEITAQQEAVAPAPSTQRAHFSTTELIHEIVETAEEDESRVGDGDEFEDTGSLMGKPEATPESGRMRIEQRACPNPCRKYLNVEDFSKYFINDILDESLDTGRGLNRMSSVKVFEGLEYTDSLNESDSIESVGTYVCVLEWPTIEEFRVELGMAKIKEFVSYWKTKEKWMCCIKYLKGESDETSDYHQYQVRRVWAGPKLLKRACLAHNSAFYQGHSLAPPIFFDTFLVLIGFR